MFTAVSFCSKSPPISEAVMTERITLVTIHTAHSVDKLKVCIEGLGDDTELMGVALRGDVTISRVACLSTAIARQGSFVDCFRFVVVTERGVTTVPRK